MILFKNKIAELDFSVIPKALREICENFETYSMFFGINPTVTRVREGVCGDSQVHEEGRAVDFRDQYVNERGELARLYTVDQVVTICGNLNEKYPRDDGRVTCLHHSFTGPDGIPMPMHFHLQLQAKALLAGEPAPRPSLGDASLP